MVCFHTGEENKLIPFVAKMCRLRATVANLYGGKKKDSRCHQPSKRVKKGEEETKGES